ncbi:hypothetical protein L1049_020693 [Liquidambar formosana]|uniref:Uncharacterized protein n=1 Tax=Liquidambar formosana TaxID=63359 RepID=A0AAP0SEC1_LIQFO
MAPDPKIVKAFSAMSALGIPNETVKPVLKNLLKLYDKKWELIEEENYRALADAIFEYEETKGVEDKKKGAIGHDGSEPPFKRLHLYQQEDQVSSTMDNSRPMSAPEEGETLSISFGQELLDSSQLHLRDRRTESTFHLPYEPSSDKGKDPVSSHVVFRDKKSASERASHMVYFKQPMDEPGSVHLQTENVAANHHNKDMIKPKSEHLFDDMPHFAVPTSMVSALPGSLEVSSTGNESINSLTSQYVDMNNKDDGSACNSCTSCKGSFDIASSPLGEVKISLNCSSALRRPNFHIPNLDRVQKYVEDKYLRSYKIVGPQFSVKKLLKDLCVSYLELADRSVLINSSPSICVTGSNEGAFRIRNSEKELCKKESSCSISSKSHSLVGVPQRPITLDGRRNIPKINDITKGAEKVKISLVNEIGSDRVPKFVYIPQNIIYQNAYVHFSMARIADEDCCSSCSGDCLSSAIPCACARETGGEFAYTPQGLLKEEFLRACISMNCKPQKHHFFYCQDCPLERHKNENIPEPCKGHLIRKFIKECWRKCGCNIQCGNRVVQRGITCNLQVFLTHEGKGWGLRTLVDLPRGAFVCEYVGEILTNTELDERNKRSSGNERHTYPVLLDADWGSEGVLKDEEALCLDATFYGNVARFINHRCFDANLLEIPVEVETPDHHYYHVGKVHPRVYIKLSMVA